jgi:hypothetical protein
MQHVEINAALLKHVLNAFSQGLTEWFEFVIMLLNTLTVVPDYLLEIPLIWKNVIRRQYAEIRSFCANRKDEGLLRRYHIERAQRFRLFRAILKQPFPKFKRLVEIKCDFPCFIMTEMLHDTNCFQIKFRIVPPEFERFNRTFPIRNEALHFLHEIIRLRASCESVFYLLGSEIKTSGVLAKEAEMVMKVNDPDYRRGAIRLLNILNESGPVLKIYETIKRSELLMALRDEELNDWENFQMLRNAWAEIEHEKPTASRPKPLFAIL